MGAASDGVVLRMDGDGVDPLSDVEVRVLGALIEKDITTPDYYPLSLNALVNACNQKNNRDPVMMLDEDAVRAALDSLQVQRLAGPASGADSRVPKYEHRLQEVFNFDRREMAICVRAAAARGADSGRAARTSGAHVSLREAGRCARSARPTQPARASAGCGAATTAGYEGVTLYAFVRRRCGSCGTGAS